MPSPVQVQQYLPVETPVHIFAFEIPENLTIDVLTDDQEAAGPGDFVQVDATGAAIRAWKRDAFLAAWRLDEAAPVSDIAF